MKNAMREGLCLVAFILSLFFGFDAMAQESILQTGLKELGLSGFVDFEGPTGGVDVDLSATYGYFVFENSEIGAFGSFSRQLDGQFKSYGLGIFGEQHFRWTRNLYPYGGLRIGWQYADVDFADDDHSLIFTPRVGVKWFLSESIAIDANLFLALATDEVYVNDRDLDRYDIGMNLGLRAYFR
jgi:hypothetical protein